MILLDNSLGELLEAVRIEKGLSLREAAELTKLGHSYIRDLELGTNRRTGKVLAPSVNSLKKIAHAYELDLYMLLDKAGLIDLEEIHQTTQLASPVNEPILIPLFHTIVPDLAKVPSTHVDYVYFPIQGRKQPDFAIQMQGDSMRNADIDDGDIIYFHASGQPEFNGQIVAAQHIDNEEVFIRRLTWDSQFPTYCLIPENTSYRKSHIPFHQLKTHGVYCGHFKPEKT